MDAVYTGMNVTDLDKTRYCYDYRDDESDPTILKCSVAMASYANTNESDVAGIAEDFVKQLRSLTDSSEIWDRPGQGKGGPFKSGAINVSKSSPLMGCLVYVKTGTDAIHVGYGLPERDVTNKAALVVACGGASREAYFDKHVNERL